MKNFFSIPLKGIIVGVTCIIPGVSGGTMAFVLGIYQQLTESIGYFFLRPEKRKEYFIFLCKFGIGAVIGFAFFVKIITFLLGDDSGSYPITYIPTLGLFLGLIVGSIPVLFKLQKDTKFTSFRLILIVLGFLTLIGVSSLKSSNEAVTMETLLQDYGLFKIVIPSTSRIFWLLLVGMLAAATLVIPGISGSALLMALGEYTAILKYIDERSIVPLGIIAIGVGVGILLCSLLMSKLLEHYAGNTFYFILGLIAASCLQLFLQMIIVPSSIIIWLYSIPTFCLGIYLAILSAKISK